MERLAQVTSRPAGDQVETKPFRPRRDGSLFRLFMCLATSLLPWGLRRRILAGLFAWNLAEDARIGIVAISAKRVELGTGSRVGHFTVCRGLDNLVLGPHALIGKANWITAHPRGSLSFGDARVPELILERDAASVVNTSSIARIAFTSVSSPPLVAGDHRCSRTPWTLGPTVRRANQS